MQPTLETQLEIAGESLCKQLGTFGLHAVMRFAYPHEISGEGSKRDREFRMGRLALSRVLKAMKSSVAAEGVEFPNPRYSVSHCDPAACSIGLLSDNGIGIDLELARPMTTRLMKFFLTESERAVLEWSAELLRYWTIKEAVFKADQENEGRTLKDYDLETPTATTGYALGRNGIRYWYASEAVGAGGWLSIAAPFHVKLTGEGVFTSTQR